VDTQNGEWLARTIKPIEQGRDQEGKKSKGKIRSRPKRQKRNVPKSEIQSRNKGPGWKKGLKTTTTWAPKSPRPKKRDRKH